MDSDNNSFKSSKKLNKSCKERIFVMRDNGLFPYLLYVYWLPQSLRVMYLLQYARIHYSQSCLQSYYSFNIFFSFVFFPSV